MTPHKYSALQWISCWEHLASSTKDVVIVLVVTPLSSCLHLQNSWGLKSGTSGLRMASPLRRSHLISVAYSFSTSRWEMHCRATEIKLLPVSHSTQSPLLLQQDAFVFVLSFFLGFAFPCWGLFAWAWRSRGSPRWGTSGCRSIHLIGTRCWLLSLTGGEQINLLFVLFKSGMKWKFILFFLNACYINLTVTDSPLILFNNKKLFSIKLS